MSSYQVGVCDTCGSEAKFINFKPDGWNSTWINDVQVKFGDGIKIGNEIGMFCSKECAWCFVGSFFDGVKQHLYEQILGVR